MRYLLHLAILLRKDESAERTGKRGTVIDSQYQAILGDCHSEAIFKLSGEASLQVDVVSKGLCDKRL